MTSRVATLVLALAACQAPAERAQRLLSEADQRLAEHDLEGAGQAYGAALALQPDLAAARVGQARVLSERGDLVAARALLRGCAEPACGEAAAGLSDALRAALVGEGITPRHAAVLSGSTPDLADRLVVCDLLQILSDMAALPATTSASLPARAARTLIESGHHASEPTELSLPLISKVVASAAVRADAQVVSCDDYLKQALLMEIETREMLLRELGSAGDDDNPGSPSARQRLRRFAYHVLRARLDRLPQRAEPGAGMPP